MTLENGSHLKPGGKHVSKACLECRRRHFKCDGKIPSCGPCGKKGAQCVYVDSHRGGARRKGSRNGTPAWPNGTNNQGKMVEIEELGSKQLATPVVTSTSEEEYTAGFARMLHTLPCSKDSTKCQDTDCPARDIVVGKSDLNDASMASARKRIRLDTSIKNLHCMFAPKPELDSDTTTLDFVMDYTNIDNQMTLVFDRVEVEKRYYSNFHEAHPLLPPKHELDMYVQDQTASNELLAIMKIIGDGQIGSLYSRDCNFIQDRLVQVINLVKLSVPDLISLQVLILVSLIAHISSLHDFSRNIRHYCIHLVKQLRINTLDDSTMATNVYESPRLSHIPRPLVADNARRTYWELYFLDVIIGSADGITITALSNIPVDVHHPTYPPERHFDYRGRSDTSQLVTQAIQMNNEIKNKRPFDISLTKLKAQLSNWEIRLHDPSVFGAPALIHKDGTVNEGVHQSILMFNYAKIFAHRPFSYLWKTNAPQNPKCDDNVMEADDMPVILRADSKATIETIKTIDSANSILELLMDTNASKLLERTPLFACALALSSLVYTSAYIWVEALLEQDNLELIKTSKLGEKDLDIYAEYIKLSLSAIYPISRHWILSGKLATHVRATLHALRPKLYSKLKDGLPQIQIGIEKIDITKRPDTEEKEITTSHNDMGTTNETNSNPHYRNVEVDSGNDSTHVGSSNDVSPKFDSITPNSVSSVSSGPLQDNPIENMKGPPVATVPLTGTAFPGNNVPLETNLITENVVDENAFDTLDIASPVIDTGCDWIDKALLDFFDGN
jgi:hypothetical protein